MERQKPARQLSGSSIQLLNIFEECNNAIEFIVDTTVEKNHLYWNSFEKKKT